MKFPLPAGSSKGKYTFDGTARLVNCHAEESDNGFKIVDSDGLTEFDTVTDTACRGLLYIDDLDKLVSVHSGSTWDVTSAATATLRGTIPGIGRVRIVRNRKATPQIAFHVAGIGLYVQEGTAVAKVTDSDLPSTDIVDIVEKDGYIVALLSDGRFFWSSLNEAFDWDALSFAEAEDAADGNVGGWNFGGYLWIFGHRTIQPYRVTGDQDEPFVPMPSTIPRGLLARFTIAEVDNSLFFVGDDKIVYRLNGFSAPTRVSNHEIERLIQAEGANAPSLIAFSWSKDGHVYYSLTGQNFSVCYDANTSQWHHRKSKDRETYRINHAVSAWGKVICGDTEGGKLLYQDETVHTEDGNHMISEIRFPKMMAFPNGGILDRVAFSYVTGRGALLSTSQGYDPYLMLDYSKDGGHTFVGERTIHLGRRGVYGVPVETRRLGRFDDKGIVLRLRQSDPVPRALEATDVEIRPLNG